MWLYKDIHRQCSGGTCGLDKGRGEDGHHLQGGKNSYLVYSSVNGHRAPSEACRSVPALATCKRHRVVTPNYLMATVPNTGAENHAVVELQPELGATTSHAR